MKIRARERRGSDESKQQKEHKAQKHPAIPAKPCQTLSLAWPVEVLSALLEVSFGLASGAMFSALLEVSFGLASGAS